MCEENNVLEKIKKVMSNVDELEYDVLEKLVVEALEKYSPEDIIEKALRPAMEEIGEKFESGEYFIAELALAADVFKDIFEKHIKPRMSKKSRAERIGRIVIGTIEGDIHDIGKNIVAMVLEAAGFDVIDLGVDVPAEKFVEEAEKANADVIAISALLTTTMNNMRKVIELLEEKGLRDKYIVVVGGAPLSEEFARKIGADAYGKDAYDGLKKIRALLEKKKKGKS